jgi:UDP-N-acetyl-L-fucosamine synthase
LKLKVVTFIGTRPEIIRLSATIKLLEKTVDHCLVHTGQNYDYELNKVFFEDLNLSEPDHYLDCAKEALGETVGNIISKSFEVLEKKRPDAVLVLGDTNSCLAAYAAKRLKIPIFHMEAGNRCFDNRVPEEANRKIVDHLSDINMPYSQIARSYLLSEGFNPQQIIVTGSPMLEVITPYIESIKNSSIVSKLGLEANYFFLVSCHREENIDTEEGILQLCNLLNYLSTEFKIPVLVSTHPRTAKRLKKYSLEKHFSDQVILHKPFGFIDYLSLQTQAKLVLSDSGTITEESDILGFKAINLRESHERPEGMEEAIVPFLGFDIDRISDYLNFTDYSNSGHKVKKILSPAVRDYAFTNVSEKVFNTIISYTSFIEKRSYFK